MKAPEHSGWWSAFWLMSEEMEKDKNGGEVDIVETFASGKTWHTAHWNGYLSGEGNHQSEHLEPVKVFDPAEFHTYTLIWTPTRYMFYVDGVYQGEIENGISSENEYLKLTGECLDQDWAVADGWAGSIEELRSAGEDKFIVDYVRVWQKDSYL